MDLKQNSNASQENSNAKSINIEGIENFAKSTMSQYDNLKVVIRVRPPLPREMEPNVPFRSSVLVSKDNKGCSIVEYLGSEISEGERQREWVENPNMFQTHHFTFDYTYDMESSQADVYENTAKSAVLSVLEGYNSTIFAYGQTGTGKTFTMEGFTYDNNDPARGIIPRSIEEIFNFIESYSNTGTKFMVRASYLQIYNENISDLLKPERYNLKFREDKKKGVFVDVINKNYSGIN